LVGCVVFRSSTFVVSGTSVGAVLGLALGFADGTVVGPDLTGSSGSFG
jgi:hypothetical protein